MPYPEVIRVVCSKCKEEMLVYKENDGEEHICIKCSCVLIPGRINEPDPRHVC